MQPEVTPEDKIFHVVQKISKKIKIEKTPNHEMQMNMLEKMREAFTKWKTSTSATKFSVKNRVSEKKKSPERTKELPQPAKQKNIQSTPPEFHKKNYPKQLPRVNTPITPQNNDAKLPRVDITTGNAPKEQYEPMANCMRSKMSKISITDLTQQFFVKEKSLAKTNFQQGNIPNSSSSTRLMQYWILP